MMRASFCVALTLLLTSTFGWAQGGAYTTQFRVSPPAPTAPNPFSPSTSGTSQSPPGTSTSERFNASALPAAHRSSGVFIRNRIVSLHKQVQVTALPANICVPFWIPPSAHPRSPYEYDLQQTDPSPHRTAGTVEQYALVAAMESSAATEIRGGKTGNVILQSTPEGADAYVDGEFVGDTPLTVPVASGLHSVSVRQWGYQAWRRALTIVAGRKISIDAILREN